MNPLKQQIILGIVIAGGLVTGLASRCQAKDIAFRATGALTCDINLPPSHQVINYELEVSNSWWGIQIFRPESPTTRAFCDGTNVYITILSNPQAKIDPEIQQRYGARPVAPEVIERAPIPCYLIPGTMGLGDYSLHLPWLANCSSSYIKSHGLSPIPVPWSAPQRSAEAFYFAATGELFPDDLGLPKVVHWKFSAENVKTAINRFEYMREVRSLEDRMGEVNRIPWGDDRLDETEYKALRSDEIDGISIVQDYVMIHERVAGSADKKRPITMTVKGHQTVVGRGTGELLALPESKAGYSVTDHRFRHQTKMVDSIYYYTNNPLAAGFLDERLQLLYSRRLETQPLDPAAIPR